ncbi:MAG: hypothetical protein ACKV22_34060 [Bryobacteraceae bacterium]
MATGMGPAGSSTMVSEGLLGAEAMLTINLWDNNYCGYSPSYCPNNPPDQPWLPVFDSIEVNGCLVGQLTSEQNRTVKNRTKVPASCHDFAVAVLSLRPDPTLENAFHDEPPRYLKNHSTIGDQAIGIEVRSGLTIALEDSLVRLQ